MWHTEVIKLSDTFLQKSENLIQHHADFDIMHEIKQYFLLTKVHSICLDENPLFWYNYAILRTQLSICFIFFILEITKLW